MWVENWFPLSICRCTICWFSFVSITVHKYCWTNMQSLFYLIKDRCTLDKYMLYFSEELGGVCAQNNKSLCIYVVFNLRKKHDGTNKLLRDIKWLYLKQEAYMKAFTEQAWKAECWMHKQFTNGSNNSW